MKYKLKGDRPFFRFCLNTVYDRKDIPDCYISKFEACEGHADSEPASNGLDKPEGNTSGTDTRKNEFPASAIAPGEDQGADVEFGTSPVEGLKKKQKPF